MRSSIPKCRFNARGTPNFGLILTGVVLVLTLGEPGTVRPEGDAKPLVTIDRAMATGASAGDEEGGRLFEGDFGMLAREDSLAGAPNGPIFGTCVLVHR